MIVTEGLGKAYGSRWALRDCTLTVPAGSIVALVGRNGAGKTTLLRMLAGLSAPSAGRAEVAGVPVGQARRTVAFVGQDKPLYRGLTVAETLRLGAALNPGWDAAAARFRLAGLPLGRRVGRLSGGQRTQVAIALALGKRAPVLLLDEPMADLDPVARDELMRELLGGAAGTGTTLVLSSHVVTELAGVVDHLVLVNDGRLQLDGDLDALLDAHKLLIGPAELAGRVGPHRVVSRSVTGRQASVLVRTAGPVHDPRWLVRDVGLPDLVVAYLRDGTGLREAA